MAQQKQNPKSPQQQQPQQQILKQAAQRNRLYTSSLRRQVYSKDKKIKEYESKIQQKKQKVFQKNILKQYTSQGDQDIDVPVDGELEKGSRVFMTFCSACHTMDPHSAAQNRGPALGLIFNRIAGSDVKYPGYSFAISNSRIFWTAKNLYNFMQNPQQIIPGTTCNISNRTGLSSEQDRADLLAFFRQYTKQLQKNLKLKDVKLKGYGIVQTQLYADQQQQKLAAKRSKQSQK